MDHKFTEQIKTWLETPESESDYTVGAPITHVIHRTYQYQDIGIGRMPPRPPPLHLPRQRLGNISLIFR